MAPTKASAGTMQRGAAVSRSVPRRKVRRRSYIVDTAFQLAVIRKFMLVFLAGVGLGIANAYVVSRYMAFETYGLFERIMVGGYALVLFAISASLVFLLSLMLSHRIAGPAYRIGDALWRMAQGDLRNNVRLRRHDHLQDLAAAFNASSANVRGLIDGVRAELANTRAVAKGNERVLRHVKRMQDLVDRYERPKSSAMITRAQTRP